MNPFRAFTVVLAVIAVGTSIIATEAADAGDDASVKASAAEIGRMLKRATPGQVERLRSMPADEGPAVDVADLDVPPTSNPSDFRQLAKLREFVDANPGFLRRMVESFKQRQPKFPRRYAESHIPGIGLGQMGSDGSVRVRDADGSFMVTPGLEGVGGGGPGAGLPQSRPVAAPADIDGQYVPLPDEELAPECTDSGRRIQVVVAVPPSYQLTWTDLEKIWHSVLSTNVKIVWESVRSSNWERYSKLRVECYGPSAGILADLPVIHFVSVADLQGETVRDAVFAQMGKDYNVNTRKYLVFAKRSTPSGGGLTYYDAPGPYSPLSNSAYVQKDETAFHRWNSKPSVSIVYESGWGTHVVMHELLHGFGAVNDNANIFATGDGHCYLAFAVMCYEDEGPNAHLYPQIWCPDRTPDGLTIDCGYATYFRSRHVAPNLGYPPATWIQTHWNAGGAENRFLKHYPDWDYDISCVLPQFC